MLCKKCGTNIPDDSRTCPYCGASVVSSGQNVDFDYMGKKVFRADSVDQYNYFMQKKFVSSLLTGIVAGVVIVVAAVNVVSFFGKADITQFVKIEEHGYQGNGSVSYTVDSSKVLNEVFGVENEYDLSSDESTVYYKLVSELNNSVSTQSATTGLSNGDKVIYNIEDIKKISEDTGINFKSKNSLEYTISNLTAPYQLKVSELFDVSFMGFDGAGRVNLALKNSDKFSYVNIVNNDTVSLDGANISVFSTDINSPTLKNGDTLNLALKTSADNDSLKENYGFYIDPDEKESFTVSDLTDSEEIDVFSKVNISIVGVDGDATAAYEWDNSSINQTVSSDSKPILAAYSENSNSFRVYRASGGNSSPLINIKNDEYDDYSYGGDYDNFNIDASKSNNITGGDTIEFKITANGEDISNDTYSDHGYTFKETTYTYEVKSGSLDRYLTSKKQLTKDNVRNYGEKVREEAEKYLKDNWSYVVHGSSSFHCYDQQIKDTMIESRVFLAKTSSYGNSYDMWYVYIFKVTDSETSKQKTVSLLANISDPLIKASDSSITTNSSIAFRGYESPEDAISSLNSYKRYDRYEFTEFSFV